MQAGRNGALKGDKFPVTQCSFLPHTKQKTAAKDWTFFFFFRPQGHSQERGNERVGPDFDVVRGQGERNVRRGVNCFGSLLGKHINVKSNGG